MATEAFVSVRKSLDRHHLLHSIQDTLEYTWETALARDNHYTLFRREDLPAWVTFSAVFVLLIVFDNAVLSRHPQAMTLGRAAAYTAFWVACACGFCMLVYLWYGAGHAWMWMSGYMLEWMLSFDNLFVFHLIFSAYGTPDHLKHRPLYLGICGAVIFRLAFIFVGEYLMHAMFFMHIVFGAFLVYTAIKTVAADDDDEDPSKNPAVRWLQKKVPFVPAYDESGAFFVRVPLDDQGEPVLTDGRTCLEGEGCEKGRILGEEGCKEVVYGTLDFSTATKCVDLASIGRKRVQTRATMLFLVVICLEVSDMLFAVDSVSAIVAQVNDLFLAYTSAVFAMLGLRATFFIIDHLVRIFSLLRYGVAAVLVFIGLKLMLAHVVHVSAAVVCTVLFCCISISILASVVQDALVGGGDEQGKAVES